MHQGGRGPLYVCSSPILSFPCWLCLPTISLGSDSKQTDAPATLLCARCPRGIWSLCSNDGSWLSAELPKHTCMLQDAILPQPLHCGNKVLAGAVDGLMMPGWGKQCKSNCSSPIAHHRNCHITTCRDVEAIYYSAKQRVTGDLGRGFCLGCSHLYTLTSDASVLLL
jgi:hypothetical protein